VSIDLANGGDLHRYRGHGHARVADDDQIGEDKVVFVEIILDMPADRDLRQRGVRQVDLEDGDVEIVIAVVRAVDDPQIPGRDGAAARLCSEPRRLGGGDLLDRHVLDDVTGGDENAVANMEAGSKARLFVGCFDRDEGDGASGAEVDLVIRVFFGGHQPSAPKKLQRNALHGKEERLLRHYRS
jgi:hypothetical protein